MPIWGKFLERAAKIETTSNKKYHYYTRNLAVEPNFLDKEGIMAGMDIVIGRLLSSKNECNGLVG